MAGRRPYASRGVPRRVSNRRPGRELTALPLPGLAVGLAFALVALVFAFAPPLANARQALGGLVGRGSQPTAAQPATGVSEQTAADDLRRQISGAPAPAAAVGNAQPSVVAARRAWAGDSGGIVADQALIQRLDQALNGVDGQVSIAVKDLGSGRGAVLAGDREREAASLYKLPVLDSVFEAGLSMSEPLPITDDARSYDAGTLELGVGETLTVAEALERMVTISDNTAAVMLGSRVGPSRVNATIAALGLSATHYNVDHMTTSALDMQHLLELMARGQAVSPGASADMIHLMLRQRVNDRIPRFLPNDVDIAHKTGNLPGTVNDVGVLYGPSSTIVVAALVSDTGDETAAATGIARVAQVAYQYFEEQPPVAGRPLVPAAPTRAIPPVYREPRPVATAVRQAPATIVARTPVATAASTVAAATTPEATAPPRFILTPLTSPVPAGANPSAPAAPAPAATAAAPAPAATAAAAPTLNASNPPGWPTTAPAAPAATPKPAAPAAPAPTNTPAPAATPKPAAPAATSAPAPAKPAAPAPTTAPAPAAATPTPRRT